MDDEKEIQKKVDDELDRQADPREASGQEVFRFTKAELRAECEKYIGPIEKKAFEAGKRAGLTAALTMSRYELQAELSRMSPSAKSNPVKDTSPEALARRASVIQLEAEAAGAPIDSIEAVKMAYKEAGVPI